MPAKKKITSSRSSGQHKTVKKTTKHPKDTSTHKKSISTQKDDGSGSKNKRSTETPTTHKKRYLPLLITIGVITLFLLAIPLLRTIFDSPEPVVWVNGEEIAYAELEETYQQMPAEYKEQLNYGDVLDALIDEQLLLQAAKEDGIGMTDSEAEEYITSVLLSGIPPSEQQAEIEQILAQEGISREQFIESIRKQLIITEYIESQHVTDTVTEEEMRALYENIVSEYTRSAESQGLGEAELEQVLADIPAYEDVKENLRSQLLSTEVQELRNRISAELREEATIKYNPLYEETLSGSLASEGSFGTFREVGQDICTTDDGKPIVTLYTTSTCPHCSWIKDTFIETVTPYVENGQIEARLWELDTKDDLLTQQRETSVPQDEIDKFMEYSQGGVPAYDFGCTYIRVGNGYEGQPDGLAQEKEEFQQIIDSLLAEV